MTPLLLRYCFIKSNWLEDSWALLSGKTNGGLVATTVCFAQFCGVGQIRMGIST